MNRLGEFLIVLLRIGVLFCQLAFIVLFSWVVTDWADISGSGFIYYLKSGFAFLIALALYSIIPFSEFIFGGIIYYYCVWVWDFNPVLSFIIVFPGLVIFAGAYIIQKIEEKRNGY